MKTPWITGADALRERLSASAQTPPQDPASALPPYLESFLAHVRLLVGVPFEYLVADPRLLPTESIRFFYVDRSWTDRLVDGAMAVGKVGTREQAHHQAHDPALRATLDQTERIVRDLQRGTQSFAQAKAGASADTTPAGPITGFLLRSRAVSGWPDMEVRAFRTQSGARVQLATLRLERLQETILLALFDGVPDLVWCEEPHHAIVFGFATAGAAAFHLTTRGPDGLPVAGASDVAVPLRAGGRRVVAVSELRRRLHARSVADPAHVPPQTGAAAFALAMLAPPWRQRFEGAGGTAAPPTGPVRPPLAVAVTAGDASVRLAVEELAR
jgi:hypothetical protein